MKEEVYKALLAANKRIAQLEAALKDARELICSGYCGEGHGWHNFIDELIPAPKARKSK